MTSARFSSNLDWGHNPVVAHLFSVQKVLGSVQVGLINTCLKPCRAYTVLSSCVLMGGLAFVQGHSYVTK